MRLPRTHPTEPPPAGHRLLTRASPAEADLLRACLRARREPAQAEALPALLRDLDLRSLAAVVGEERLAPLLHRSPLPALGPLPPAVAASLEQSYRANALRNLLLLRELRGCLDDLARAGIEAIVLKGAALAEGVYRNPALRPMGDLDLLVRRAEVEPARRVLAARGFELGRAETHPGALVEHENEILLWKPGRVRVDLDLHWSLIDSPFHQQRTPEEWFWQTARAAAIGGAPARVLGAEALVLHLCAHLALHHGGTGLLWWNDIAEVLAAEGADLDWGELAARAQDFGLLLPVRQVLAALAVEWGAPVPAAALRDLEERQPSRQEARAIALLQNPGSAGRRFWSDLAAMPSWRQRLRYARTHVLPSPEYMRRRYGVRHPLLLPLYYPYRWLRGALGLR